MNVGICSRQEAEELLRQGFPAHTAVISFSDPVFCRIDPDYKPVDYTGKAERVFQAALHDIDRDILADYGLTYETFLPEAHDMAEFILNAEHDGLDIICQCEHGQSRSAACAAAILEFFYKDGISVFADYRYYPNQLVYHKVFDALKEARKSLDERNKV